jgi:hypothetical protein
MPIPTPWFAIEEWGMRATKHLDERTSELLWRVVVFKKGEARKYVDSQLCSSTFRNLSDKGPQETRIREL